MTHLYSKSFKLCARCNYWGGVRTVDRYGMNVTIDSPSSKGKCLKQGGPWRNQDVNANAHCSEWASWAVLK